MARIYENKSKRELLKHLEIAYKKLKTVSEFAKRTLKIKIHLLEDELNLRFGSHDDDLKESEEPK